MPMSRGAVVSNFLVEDVRPEQYVAQLRENDSQIGGYNVVVGNLHTGSLWAHSNRGDQGSVHLGTGLHAMSNGRLSDTWPKMRKGLERLEPMLTTPTPDTGAHGCILYHRLCPYNGAAIYTECASAYAHLPECASAV